MVEVRRPSRLVTRVADLAVGQAGHLAILVGLIQVGVVGLPKTKMTTKMAVVRRRDASSPTVGVRPSDVTVVIRLRGLPETRHGPHGVVHMAVATGVDP